MKTWRVKYFQLSDGTVFRISDVKRLFILKEGEYNYKPDRSPYVVVVNNFGSWLYIQESEYWELSEILKYEMEEIPMMTFEMIPKIEETIQQVPKDELYESHPSYSELFSDREC